MTDIISTGIAIDSSDAVKAKQDLDNLAGSGDKVDSALSKIDKAGERTGRTLATLASYSKQMTASSGQMVSELQKMNSAQARQEALLKSLGSAFGALTTAINSSTAAEAANLAASTKTVAALGKEEAAVRAVEQARRSANAASTLAAANEKGAAFRAAQLDAARQSATAEAAAKQAAAAATENYMSSLRSELTLHGASKTQIEAHRAAQAGLTAEEQKAAVALRAQIEALRTAQQAEQQAAAAKMAASTAAAAYLQKLREEVQLHGASRAKIEAHRAAQMGLTAEQQRSASALGGQLDALNATRNSLTAVQQAGIAVGSAMATAFVAKRVYDFADALFQASAAAQRIKTTLQFATGDSAKEFAYLTTLADKLGLQFTDTAKAYASFSAATRGTTLEGDATRKVFESVSKAAAVMGLSSEQASGALLALQQMVSNGTVQAEELRGQLGERLPGAFGIAAKAMGVTTAELGKMLQQGQVLAVDFLPKFADALNLHIGDASEKAAGRLDASVNRMNNAWERLKRNTGDSGVSEFMAGQYNILTDAFNGVAESIAVAKSEGDGFTGQMLSAAGAVAGFLNPLNAVSYSAQSSGEKLREAEARLKALQERARAGIDVRVQMGRLEEFIAKLREAKREADGTTGVGGGRGTVNPETAAQITARRAAAQAERDAYYSDNARQTQSQIRAEERAKATKRNADLVKKAEGDTNEVLKLQGALKTELANIDDKYKGKKGASSEGVDRQNDRAQVQYDLEKIQRDQQAIVDRNGNTEKLLEARRSAGLVNEREYYAQRLNLLRSDGQAQEASLQKQIERLERESFAGKSAAKDRLDNDRKLIELRSQLTKVQEATATNEQVLALQATTALNQQTAALLAARNAAQDYLDTTQRANERQIAGIGRGSQQRDFDAGVSQIEERYAQQRQNIQSQRAQAQALAGGKLTEEARKQFDEQLAIITEFQSKSIESYKGYYSTLKEAQGNWINGATEALQNYIDGVNNASKRAEELVTEGLGGLTDSVTDAIMGDGKTSFEDLGKSIAKQIIKGIVEQQITKPIAEWLQGSLKDQDSIFGKLFGGLTSNKGTGENWLGMLGLGGKSSGSGSDPLGDLLKSKGLVGDAAATASAAASTTAFSAALTTGTAAATAALSALASAATASAAAMGGSSASGLGGLFSGAGGLLSGAGGSSDALGALIALNGWSGGGFTGPGGKYQPAGIVHKGEGVLSQPEIRAIGGESGFNALRQSIRRGYAHGGFGGSVMSGNFREPRGFSRTPMIINYQAQPGETRKTAAQNGRAFADQAQRFQRRDS